MARLISPEWPSRRNIQPRRMGNVGIRNAIQNPNSIQSRPGTLVRANRNADEECNALPCGGQGQRVDDRALQPGLGECRDPIVEADRRFLPESPDLETGNEKEHQGIHDEKRHDPQHQNKNEQADVKVIEL